MTSPVARIGAFVAGLLAVFGIAFGVGVAVGPWDVDTAPSHSTHQQESPQQGSPQQHVTTEVPHDGH
ncbi:hypothetical protein MUG78_05375 [Gordonia alkaliphila]|uniref:Uncharacterized protein n=1 Tax=Gordonia alkaliphila TaxID=1053547 RepID=A0ABP8ZBC0_9ACTN|nr:hypothetical protein [Gordonia alkaliphila]MCK0438911.1 hypothetical protein [Gordonia alkaliphila]